LQTIVTIGFFLSQRNHTTDFCGGNEMANIKSAKKRIEVAAIRTEKNKAIKSKVKTSIKKVDAAIAAEDKAAATEALKNATVDITKAASKGVYHKNNASRKVSRLATAVNKMA
jgi:small subunit ribosomal protein S20